MFPLFRSTICRNLKSANSQQVRNLCTQVPRIPKLITMQNIPITSSRGLFTGLINTPGYQRRLLYPSSILSFRQLSTNSPLPKTKPLDLSQDIESKPIYQTNSNNHRLPSDEELSTGSQIVIGATICTLGVIGSYYFVKYLLMPGLAAGFLVGWIGINVLAYAHPLLLIAFIIWMMS